MSANAELRHRPAVIGIQSVKVLPRGEVDPLASLPPAIPVSHAAIAHLSNHRVILIGIEAPIEFAGRRIERNYSKLRRRREQLTVHYDRIAFHFRARKGIAAIERPRNLKLRDILAIDLFQARVVNVVRSASIAGPAASILGWLSTGMGCTA